MLVGSRISGSRPGVNSSRCRTPRDKELRLGERMRDLAELGIWPPNPKLALIAARQPEPCGVH